MHLEKLAHKSTVVGTIIAILLFMIAIVEVYHFNELVTESQKSTIGLTILINKTDNLLVEMQKSTTSLATLVNKTDQLIQSQNRTSSSISQQTILKEYADGVPFKVDISYCNYEPDNEIAYSPVILDKNNNPTPLKFMLVRFIGYYTTTDAKNMHIVNKHTLDYDETPDLVIPNEEKLYKLSLLPALNKTDNSTDSYLVVRSEYYFAPYSDATDQLITKYVYDGQGHQMIEFKKDTSGNWKLYPSPNSVCK
jgi:hypothetical protein